MNSRHSVLFAVTFTALFWVTGCGAESNESLQASVRSGQLTGSAPLHVSLELLITGGTSPYDVSWDLGSVTIDGNPITFTYFQAGTYRVLATVTDADGQRAYAETTVDVIPDPAELSFSNVNATILTVDDPYENGGPPYDLGDDPIVTLQAQISKRDLFVGGSVQNLGESAAAGFHIGLVGDSSAAPAFGTADTDVHVPGLPSGAADTFSMRIENIAPGPCSPWIVADTYQDIPETNEADNKFSVGAMTSFADIDRYTFNMTGIFDFQVVLDSLPRDYDLRVTGPNGINLVSENSNTTFERITFNNAPAGSYTIHVTSYTGLGDDDSYRLRVMP